MSNEKKYEDHSEGHAEAASGRPQGESSPAAASGPKTVDSQAASGSAAAAGESGEVDRLKAEVADLKDRLLRTHAEMDNVRKRLEREKADQAKFAITKFARDVVAIGDNVQRAIDAVPSRMAEQDAALKSFVEGVTMIEREMVAVLTRHGIKRLDPKGEPFDPHLHQAVVEVPSAEAPAGTVTQVFQPGYLIEERVLRPAMVAVSKGGPKPQPPAEAVTGETATGPADDSDNSPSGD